jgi:hypothetical protein
MSHVAKSKILEEIIIELRKKGLEIPPNVMSDLKSARTLLKVEKADSKGMGETEPKIDQYIGSVEAYVITEAAKLFSSDRVDKWLTALDIASCETGVTIEEPKEEMRFIPGVPRDQKWIRAEPTENSPKETFEKTATEMKLSYKNDSDGHLIVYGSAEKIKEFIKEISLNENKKRKKIKALP